MGRGGQLHEPCSPAAPSCHLAKLKSDDDVSRDPEVAAAALCVAADVPLGHTTCGTKLADATWMLPDRFGI